jgi:hypothetical protein
VIFSRVDFAMGLSLSKCKKPNGGGQSQVSSFLAAILSREGGDVYTTVDEPNFLRPYRDVSMTLGCSFWVAERLLTRLRVSVA